jgi:hypothetical protein
MPGMMLKTVERTKARRCQDTSSVGTYWAMERY